MSLGTEENVETTQDSQTNQGIREDLVNTAVKFLQNPKVINSPLSQKQKFLQRRGLNEEEIRVACEKSGAYTHHEQTQNLPPLPPPAPINLKAYETVQFSFFHRLRELVHNIALFSIVAYVINKFYEKYVAPFLFGRRKKSVEDKIDTLEENVTNSISDIKQSLVEVTTEISQLKDLKSEVASVKGLLLTRKQFPSVANTPVVPPSIPAWQMSSVHQESEHEGESEENKEELMEVGSGSGSSEPEHGMKTSESSLEIINHEDIV